MSIRWLLSSITMALCFCAETHAQVQNAASGRDTLVVVFGVVKDITSKDTLREISVEAIDRKWGRRLTARVDVDGSHQLDIMDEADWLIEFSAKGYAPKRVRIDMRGPSAADWIGGYGMNIDMLLLRELPDMDYSALDEPMGHCRYDSVADVFLWDSLSVALMRERTAPLMEAYNKRLAAIAR